MNYKNKTKTEIIGELQTAQERIRQLEKERLDSQGMLANLPERKALTSDILDTYLDIIIVIDENYNIVWGNKSAREFLGITIESKKCYEIIHNIETPCDFCGMEQLSKGASYYESEAQITTQDGSRKNYLMTITALERYPDGKPKLLLGIYRDITEQFKYSKEQQRLAEQALRESEDKYHMLIEMSGDAIYLVYNDKFEVVNKRFCEMFGVTAEEVYSPDFDIYSIIAPRSRKLIKERENMRKAGDTPKSDFLFFAQDKEGREIEVEASIIQFPYGEGIAVQGIIRDITDKRQLESQFRQAQKMEAVGRLAGGVAHDFNNMLTAIFGHCDLASMKAKPGDPLLAELKEIKRSSQLAADLTKQLLVFSRKDPVEVKILNLNDIAAKARKMLQRIIGEDVDLVTLPEPELWKIEADPVQLEQVIMNIVVNARDAMPEGGQLTIETANVTLCGVDVRLYPEARPGAYVLLMITDTGVGMTEDVKQQIFEPYFTTKDTGKGTGLGLSTVYGIVKRFDGFMIIESELGRGTSFEVYFPKAEGEEVESADKKRAAQLPKGTENILVVEDEEAVRDSIVKILKRLGYNVIEAKNGRDALMRCQNSDSKIDLALTDIVLPGMSGTEFVSMLRELWNDVKVLYISGYSRESIIGMGFHDDSAPFLQKPFDPLALARAMREVLDAK